LALKAIARIANRHKRWRVETIDKNMDLINFDQMTNIDLILINKLGLRVSLPEIKGSSTLKYRRPEKRESERERGFIYLHYL